jgi:hypothetical protein
VDALEARLTEHGPNHGDALLAIVIEPGIRSGPNALDTPQALRIIFSYCQTLFVPTERLTATQRLSLAPHRSPSRR